MANDLEELDLVSAVWILASNDENHLVTYEGIRERLGLDENFNVRNLVLKRRELFRLGAPPGESEKWQADMRNGDRLPPWIKLIPDNAQRLKVIEDFSDKDVFRSQFRANRGAPKSDIAIVNWGLDHIDRIRKGRIASREASAKSWQMWLVLAIGIANIFATLAIAYVKGIDSMQSKPVAVTAQPVVPADRPPAGVR